jgi:hypothetical protein
VKRLLLASLAALAGCTVTPPAHWAQGGAVLDLPRARWIRDDVTVDLFPDGKVLVNGDHELTIDRAGRVFDTSAEPIALLEPDGRLVGTDERPLGQVGALHASLPDRATAWLTVTDSGQVIRYDDEGDRLAYGAWSGCEATPRTRQACTLVTHLYGMRQLAREERGGVVIGVGMGVRVR